MKLETKHLLAALNQVAAITKVRTSLPVLRCIKLDGDRAEATNLDVHLRVKLPSPFVDTPLCVPADTLTGVLSRGTDNCEISVVGDKLVVECGGTAKLATINASEFPPFPAKGALIGLPVTDLADGIEAVAWAADPKAVNERNFKRSVVVWAAPKSLKTMGFDGKAGAFFNRALICAKAEFMFQADAADMLLPALRAEGEVAVALAESYLIATSPDTQVAVRLFEFDAPNFDGALKAERKPLGEHEIEPIAAAMQMAAMLSGDSWAKVRVMVAPECSKMTLEDTANGFSSPLPFRGEERWFGIDAKRALKFLRGIKSDKAKFSLGDKVLFAEYGDTIAALAHMTL